MIPQLNASQVLLNKLYIPIIRNGRPSLIKSKEVDTSKKCSQMCQGGLE